MATRRVPSRNRVATSKVAGTDNSEAPSVTHQNVAAVKPILDLIKKLGTLSSRLPETVPEAGAADTVDIHRIVTSLPGHDDTVAGRFTRRFDVLFGQDTRDADGHFINIRRGERGMACVVSYLRSIHWESSEIGLERAVDKLTSVVKELEHLCSAQPTPPKRTATSGASKEGVPSTQDVSDTPQSGPGSAAYEQRMDEIFDAAVNGGKADKLYKPRNPGNLSEEEEDDFEIEELDKPENIPEGSRKRKVIVIDGDEQAGTVPKPKKKAKKTATATPSAPPKVTVIEIEDEDDTVHAETKRGPVSNSRDHFFPPVAVTVNSEKRWEFKCRHVGCKTSYTFRRTVSKTASFESDKPQPPLGNLRTHIGRAGHSDADIPGSVPTQAPETRGISAASAKIMEDYLREGKLNPAANPTQRGFNKVFAAWIVEDDHPFTTGETGGIQRLFQYMQTRFILPSDTTVRNTLCKLYVEMFETLKLELANVKSKIAGSTDTWSTRSMMFTFAGSIASWISEDWELIERVIDFHPISDKEHEGEYAAAALAERLSELGILEKITLSLDNAAVNNVMICALSRILRENFDIQWTPENSQIRCLAHVVNLVVQKILAALEEAEDPDVEDYYIPHKDLPFHYDPNADPDLAGLEQEKFEKEHEGTAEEDADAVFMAALAPELKKLSPLAKLRATTVKICSSPQRRKRFKSGSTELYQGQRAESGKLLCSLMVVRDVKHRWNYTSAMIERALILKKAVDKFVFDREELRSLLLQREEWQLLEKLGAMLKIFTHVTLQMSKSHTPTLPWVLPMYEHMVKALGVNRDDETLLPSLRTAATAGLEKLNVYYEKAKLCQFNVIATLLHPRLGMRWFKNLDKDRAANAKILFEFAFDAYEKTHAEKLKRAPKSPRKVAKSGNSFLDDPEFERFYMAYQTHGRGDINKPLAWWKVGSESGKLLLQVVRIRNDPPDCRRIAKQYMAL